MAIPKGDSRQGDRMVLWYGEFRGLIYTDYYILYDKDIIPYISAFHKPPHSYNGCATRFSIVNGKFNLTQKL